MTLKFRQRNFIRTDREVMVVGLERETPVVFVIDLSVARTSLDLKTPKDIMLALERWRGVLESACLRAYARRVRDQENSRIHVDEEDLSSALAMNATPAHV